MSAPWRTGSRVTEAQGWWQQLQRTWERIGHIRYSRNQSSFKMTGALEIEWHFRGHSRGDGERFKLVPEKEKVLCPWESVWRGVKVVDPDSSLQEQQKWVATSAWFLRDLKVTEMMVEVSLLRADCILQPLLNSQTFMKVDISFPFYRWGNWGLETLTVLIKATAKLLPLCPTLRDPIDSSPPGSPVPGILQAITLEWVAISFSNAWKGKVKVKLLSHVRLVAAPWTAAYQAPPSMRFSRQEYWSGVPLLSQWLRLPKSLVAGLGFHSTLVQNFTFPLFRRIQLIAKASEINLVLCHFTASESD